ncbi:hypothetical protein Sgou_18370 [Streptomyces gougerotii]|uniref:Uncharacterized protein n=2 Tax=Streptomyces diastaticus group TaxID=2849069 RepID=A0A8H9HTN1_9ACTN|nr:hypothetical protein Srut_02070 [Streptomyces rutgersensis]GFH74860.1 hypothetical protein Sdia_56280 [Streptomyces diastaticus subsp. diastaticus]GFH77167.1 hypothetical protein Sgou_18370 [Streptomyces gougerotii]GGU05840.1 hypothetical protein GCM10015534_04970 [Streptomyces diastaticus subsp. diastaticus]GGU87610.1 hypothetical protein GCM10010227_47710 [Streptomyces gougerotii]
MRLSPPGRGLPSAVARVPIPPDVDMEFRPPGSAGGGAPRRTGVASAWVVVKVYHAEAFIPLGRL